MATSRLHDPFNTPNPGHTELEEDQEIKTVKMDGIRAPGVVRKPCFDCQRHGERKLGGKVPN